ncbi:MAG: AlkA N-terminal domain-containing protein [Microbacteriaceae bacterium]
MADPAFAERYRRASAHDRRYDGYFVTGQPMSEIFCRPGCSIRTPRPSQVAFYPTVAAAHAAGLTPCPRCRPDATCSSPELALVDTVAARALRLIVDGEIERTGADGLARRLGLTTRQVLRAVEAEAGCGPLAVARTARAGLARVLLTSTTIAMSEVATASGFTSVRQFNSTIDQFYRTTPGALRSGARPRTAATPGSGQASGSAQGPGSGPLVLRCALPLRKPYDASGIFRFLTDRAIPDIEEGGELWYARAVRLPHAAGHLRVDSDGRGGLLAKLSVGDPRDLIPLYARVRRLFDLDADPIRIDERLSRDPALAPSVADHPGIRVPGAVDIEETLFRAMVGQHTSVATARTMLGGLTHALGDATPWGLLFPTAARIAEHGRDVLRGTGNRIDAIINVAREIASGRLELHWGSSRSQLASTLTAHPGIGAWTVGYVSLRTLGDPDALLAGDLAIRQGAEKLGLPADAATLARHGMLWSPWRSYAGMHLWRAAQG